PRALTREHAMSSSYPTGRNKYLPAVAAAILLVFPLTAWSGATTKPAAGVEGSWAFRQVGLYDSKTMIFTFAKGPDGSVEAVFDSRERRLRQEFSAVTAPDGKVWIKEKGVPIFEAQLSADKAFLEGKVMWSGAWQPIKLARLDKRPEFPRPQES